MKLKEPDCRHVWMAKPDNPTYFTLFQTGRARVNHALKRQFKRQLKMQLNYFTNLNFQTVS